MVTKASIIEDLRKENAGPEFGEFLDVLQTDSSSEISLIDQVKSQLETHFNLELEIQDFSKKNDNVPVNKLLTEYYNNYQINVLEFVLQIGFSKDLSIPLNAWFVLDMISQLSTSKQDLPLDYYLVLNNNLTGKYSDFIRYLVHKAVGAEMHCNGEAEIAETYNSSRWEDRVKDSPLANRGPVRGFVGEGDRSITFHLLCKKTARMILVGDDRETGYEMSDRSFVSLLLDYYQRVGTTKKIDLLLLTNNFDSNMNNKLQQLKILESLNMLKSNCYVLDYQITADHETAEYNTYIEGIPAVRRYEIAHFLKTRKTPKNADNLMCKYVGRWNICYKKVFHQGNISIHQICGYLD
uniref:6-phosphofructokinase gamma subunit n=1 Tax=Komagataella pseudopastoris TaxID=169507 RepID=A5GYD9_9ASCO|nr:6-phosphofructokinase gamma subunit [Komagataella pseudopastoris]